MRRAVLQHHLIIHIWGLASLVLGRLAHVQYRKDFDNMYHYNMKPRWR